MPARKIVLYLLPPVLIGCLVVGVYLHHRARNSKEEPTVTAPPLSPAGPDGSAAAGGQPPEEHPQQTVKEQDAKDGPNLVPEALTTEELTAQAADFSPASFWANLLAQSDPPMRLVKAIDAVAHGERPMDALDFLHVETPFTAAQDDSGNWLATAQSYRRYQEAVDFVDSLDPQKVAALFRKAEPVLQKCCQRLGYQDMTIRQLLTEACNTILTTPRFDFDPLLVPTGTTETYHFADPAFEQLNDAQKLLVRLGPENCAKIQAKCDAIADALGLYQSKK